MTFFYFLFCLFHTFSSAFRPEGVAEAMQQQVAGRYMISPLFQ